MARRPMRRRGNGSNPAVQLVQIVGLVLVLVIILLFRDKIGLSAGNFFGAFDSEDVTLPEEAGSTTGAEPSTAAPAAR